MFRDGINENNQKFPRHV